MRIYSSNRLVGEEGPKELKSCVGTDTQLHTDAAQPSDLDLQQMSRESSRPILNGSILITYYCLSIQTTAAVYIILRNSSVVLLIPPSYIKKKTKKCTSTPFLLSPGPTAVNTFSYVK